MPDAGYSAKARATSSATAHNTD